MHVFRRAKLLVRHTLQAQSPSWSFLAAGVWVVAAEVPDADVGNGGGGCGGREKGVVEGFCDAAVCGFDTPNIGGGGENGRELLATPGPRPTPLLSPKTLPWPAAGSSAPP